MGIIKLVTGSNTPFYFHFLSSVSNERSSQLYNLIHALYVDNTDLSSRSVSDDIARGRYSLDGGWSY